MTIVLDLLRPLTDEELRQLAERNPGYQFERAADGRLIVGPTGMESGKRSGEVYGQLRDWNRRTEAGVVFDSSTGFHLPDGSLLSPDASWLRRERWEQLSIEEREGFGRFCPDVVFEVRSPSQSLQELRQKMEAYVRNGAALAVLVDPYAQAVEVYRPGRQPEVHQQVEHLALEPELPGFVLDLAPIFES